MLKVVDLFLGFWLAISWVIAFALMLQGLSILELNKGIALLELAISSVLVIYFLIRTVTLVRAKLRVWTVMDK